MYQNKENRNVNTFSVFFFTFWYLWLIAVKYIEKPQIIQSENEKKYIFFHSDILKSVFLKASKNYS